MIRGADIREHDEELWYPDGNIILVARGVAFRVYRGWLAARSEVFKDLFSFPQPKGPGICSNDGCPIVAVYDSPEDLRYFLRALMFGPT